MSGHGWVKPLPGGRVARCGGPWICSDCRAEYAALNDAQKKTYDEAHPEYGKVKFPVIDPKTGEVMA